MKTLYLITDDQVVSKNGNNIAISHDNTVLTNEQIFNISDIVIMGNTQITSQALKFLITNGVNITHADKSGNIYAFTNAMNEKRCDIRLIQYSALLDENFKIGIARIFCRKKIQTQIDYLYSKRKNNTIKDCKEIEKLLLQLSECNNINDIMGVEGYAARIYFKSLSCISMLDIRTRRPAKDIYNSLLNLTYSLLLHKVNVVVFSKGLDISLGFLHSQKSGRPSLSLDFLELFRTEADKFVTTITNRKEFTQKDFVIDRETGGYCLTNDAFKKYIKKYSQSILIDENIEKMINLFILTIKTKDVNIFDEA